MSSRSTSVHRRAPALGALSLFVMALGWWVAPLPVGHAVQQPGPAGEIGSYLDGVVSSGVPGAAAVVTRGDRVVVSTGRGSAIDSSTRFPVASLSKSFTATAVMQLVEQGSVRLDEPVVTYLPELTTADPRSDDITVRQILNQSSGLTDRTLGFDQYAAGPRSAEQAVGRLEASRLAYEPGSSMDYCNVNYWIAERLVEVVSRETFAGYLERHVLTPLGMERTSFTDVPADADDVVPTYSYAFGHAVRLGDPESFSGGAGGVITTADDLGRWLRFQLGHRVPGQRGAVLDPASLREMHRRQSPVTEYSVGYALGWWNGEPADGGVERISHSGTGAGVSAYQGLFPDDLAIGVLINAGGPRADQVAEDVRAIVSGELPARTVTAPSPWRDLLATVAAAAALLAGARGAKRAGQWVSRRGRWHRVTSLSILTVIGAALATLPTWASLLVGRQATWTVLWFTAPVPTIAIWVGVSAVVLVVVSRGASVWNRSVRSP